MNSERAERLVTALRARGVMAHLAEVGVYQFGVRVVIDWNIEAIWDTDGAAGLDAQVLSDGMLVGFVPHIEGSEDFTEQQLIDTIATTRYSTEGLRPPAGADTGTAPADSGARSTGAAADTGARGVSSPGQPGHAGSGEDPAPPEPSSPAAPPPSPADPAPPPPPGPQPAPPDHRRPKDRWWRR
ncbi:hypothetical protein [Streptomyces sp. NBC_00388]|uniref:hypothetical protein n=1 Tax=Streptomyces sp. NBC_00388 TaxID=2975735 RepID=UPI002E1DEE2C